MNGKDKSPSPDKPKRQRQEKQIAIPLVDVTASAVDAIGRFMEQQEYPPPGVRHATGDLNWSAVVQASVVKMHDFLQHDGHIPPETMRGYFDVYEQIKNIESPTPDKRALPYVPLAMIVQLNTIGQHLMRFESSYEWARNRHIKHGTGFNLKLVVIIALLWNQDYVRSKRQS